MKSRLTGVFVAVAFLGTLLPVEAAVVPIAGKASWATGVVEPRISPDGQSVAGSYQGSIAVVSLKTGAMRILTHGEGWDVSPVWSPDGKRIAYIKSPNHSAGRLAILNTVDGSEVKLPVAVGTRSPIWFHPDGMRLLGKLATRGPAVRISWLDLKTGEVEVVKGIEDSSGTRRATFALSSDGNSIYFTSQYDQSGEQGGNNGPQADVFRISAGGGIAEKLFQWPARIYNCAAADNGAGLYIATDLGTTHNDIWFVPFDKPNANAKKISFGQADEDWPSVSVNGDKIVFTDNRDGATGLVVANPRENQEERVMVRSIDYGSAIGNMRLKLDDPRTSEPYAARVSIKRKDGKYFAPPGAMYHITAGLGYFISRGDVAMRIPVGVYEIRVFRGTEWIPDLTEATITANGGLTEQVFHPANTRWVHMANRGWYSGENHIHANYGYGQWYNTPQSIRDWVEAEDLNVANLVIGNSDGDSVFDRSFFRGGPDPLSDADTILWWNEEFRSTSWGHMTLFHLKQLVEPIFTGFKNTTNPRDIPANYEILRRTRMQNGAAGYTHPTNNREDFYDQPYSAKGLPVDVALGLVDCADFMGVVYENAIPYWYELLNAGFRLPASAGTDCFLNRANCLPPGWGRVYVHLPDGLDYAKWVEGVKAGRSFVSNGPVLEFSANAAAIGDTIRLKQPGKVRVRGKVESQFPLETLEVVHNGKVIATVKPGHGRATTIDQDVAVTESGWLAVRASGKPVRYWPGRSQGAHTNPIYLQVAAQPQNTKKSAEYFLKWIDRLEAQLRERDRIPPSEWEDVKKHLDLAREVYQGKVSAAARSRLVR